jgi:hypothetical protein
MKEGKHSFFWVSYADLMTSLFFIMLVLFILTIAVLNEKNKETEAKAKYYDQIIQIDSTLSRLAVGRDFTYLPSCKKYVITNLIGKELFLPMKTTIKEEFKGPTISAGRKVESFLKSLNAVDGFSFVVVIEGNMANYINGDPRRKSINNSLGYKLSYERAHSVYELWRISGIDLKKYNAEVIIAGSGFSGACRDPKEENNKRFTIQIIPKIEKLK